MEQDSYNAPKQDLIAGQEDQLLDFEIQAYEDGVRKARNTLFLIAGLVVASEFISAYASHIDFNGLFIGIVLVEAGIFVGLAFLTKTKPYLAILIGLIAFILLWGLAILNAGLKGAFGGIIFKIVIITYLIKALTAAKSLEAAREIRKLNL